MTRDQLLEAIQELRKMGYEVVNKDYAYIPKQAKEEIIEDLEYYSKTISERLETIGFTETNQISDENPLMGINAKSFAHYNKEGEFKGYEVDSLDRAVMAIQGIKDHIRDRDLIRLFQDSVFLGENLLPGDAPHPYDEEKNKGKKGGKKSKRKPWADALAEKLCHLNDDEIYWTLVDDESEIQIETEDTRYDIIFKEDPITLTHDLVQALPFDAIDTPQATQTIRLSTFLKHYIRPARKKLDKV